MVFSLEWSIVKWSVTEQGKHLTLLEWCHNETLSNYPLHTFSKHFHPLCISWWSICHSEGHPIHFTLMRSGSQNPLISTVRLTDHPCATLSTLCCGRKGRFSLKSMSPWPWLMHMFNLIFFLKGKIMHIYRTIRRFLQNTRLQKCLQCSEFTIGPVLDSSIETHFHPKKCIWYLEAWSPTMFLCLFVF